MPIENQIMSDQLWVTLCSSFGMILLGIVSIVIVLLLLCGCQTALLRMTARSGRER